MQQVTFFQYDLKNPETLPFKDDHTVPKEFLERTVFQFSIIEWSHSYGVYLEGTWVERRPSPRAKWVIDKTTLYSRLNQRDVAIKEEPEVPRIVRESAVWHYQSRIFFMKWRDGHT